MVFPVSQKRQKRPSTRKGFPADEGVAGDGLVAPELPFPARSMRRAHTKRRTKVPISQKTILIIYGLLVELAEYTESALDSVEQPAFMPGLAGSTVDPVVALEGLRKRAWDAQREAVELLLRDDPKVEINPITGRLV